MRLSGTSRSSYVSFPPVCASCHRSLTNGQTSSKHNREEHVAKAKETAALFLEIHEKHNQTWYLKKEAEERKGKGEVIDTDGFLEWSVELPWKNNLRCPCGYGHPRPKGEGNVLK